LLGISSRASAYDFGVWREESEHLSLRFRKISRLDKVNRVSLLGQLENYQTIYVACVLVYLFVWRIRKKIGK
jgi:hypothetical protein